LSLNPILGTYLQDIIHWYMDEKFYVTSFILFYVYLILLSFFTYKKVELRYLHLLTTSYCSILMKNLV